MSFFKVLLALLCIYALAQGMSFWPEPRELPEHSRLSLSSIEFAENQWKIFPNIREAVVTCDKIRAHEIALKSLAVGDSRLTVELRNAINDLTTVYRGQLHNLDKIPNGLHKLDTGNDFKTFKPDSACEAKTLVRLVEYMLLQVIAAGPSRETHRILSDRLVAVLDMMALSEQEEYKKEDATEERFANDVKAALEEIKNLARI